MCGRLPAQRHRSRGGPDANGGRILGPRQTSPAATGLLWQSGRVQTRTNGRGAGRAQATRAGLLSAARDVFAESGFADANIADVVTRAGASVGSLYHHFGGKADLYLALFEDFQARQEARAADAVRRSRAEGVSDPLQLFLAGASAYLAGCWDERDLARVFLDGGGPAGFELIARRRYREWIGVN